VHANPQIETGRDGRIVSWACLAILVQSSVIAGACLADEPTVNRSTCWVEMDRLAAPEAIQAAAADDDFVYAIANSQVAQYSRTLRTRTAVSQGDAEHLNSGFFWKGQLYCAHSNYPKLPERSQIKVLDPKTMRLTTFHDFEDFGGSLTWVIREGDHWWCNFAHYGKSNHRTFLVQFNNDWKELARWTYPASVISQLGSYSLSGGIWRHGELLVTGHDDPVLFRLSLPDQGNELIDKGRAAVPFTGQGFAADPITGGLIGIDRAKRQLKFASAVPSTRLRLLTYNIHHGEGVDGKLDLERIARVIQSESPDIVALQEVDRRARRSGSVDQPEELARLLKMHVLFGDNIPLQGGHYGNVLLSRYPFVSSTNHLLPRFDSGEQRGVIEAEVSLGGQTRIRLFATHLDHRPADRERIASARQVEELAVRHPDQPAVLLGDLNADPESAVLGEFRTKWTRPNSKILPTIPVETPTTQIDYVLCRPAPRWIAIESRVLDEKIASDHRPLLVVIDLLDQSK